MVAFVRPQRLLSTRVTSNKRERASESREYQHMPQRRMRFCLDYSAGTPAQSLFFLLGFFLFVSLVLSSRLKSTHSLANGAHPSTLQTTRHFVDKRSNETFWRSTRNRWKMLGSWWCGAIVLVCARCLASYLCWCDTFFPLCPYVAHTPPALWCPRLHLPLAVLVKQPYCAASEKPWKPRLKKLWINTLSFFFLFFPPIVPHSQRQTEEEFVR